MAERHLRKCLTFLAIREMQIKTTLSFHLKPIRMANIKNTDANLCCRGTLLHCWYKYKLTKSLWISIWQFLRKLGNNLPRYPVIPHLGIYPKNTQSYNKGMCSTMFIAALFVITSTWKQHKCPLTEEWIRKMRYIYTMEYYTAEKK